MSSLWITPEELGVYANTEFSYEACKTASNLLWAMSGRKYSGLTTVTERYVCASRKYRYGASIRNHSAELLRGQVYNIPTTNLDFFDDISTDGISPARRVKLRGRPVTQVHAIRNRVGELVDPSSYYLVDHSTIQAVPGSAWTPCDIEITYSYGVEPPTMGKMAARTLAMEFCKLWNGDDDCILPQRVTSISRQGVSYTLLDQQDFIEEMRTGLYAVDIFLKSVNPDKARAKARVFSPDVPRARRNTPKPLKLGVSDLDIVVKVNQTGEMTIPLVAIDAEFLAEELGWTPYAVLRNYGESKFVTVEDAAVLTDNDSKIKVTIGYKDTNTAIGLVDPGTWDLYAERTNGAETETVFIASGNLTVSLFESTTSAYTLT